MRRHAAPAGHGGDDGDVGNGRGGGADAGERLSVAVREHGMDVLAYLQRRTQPVEDAADLLSEVFVIAWRKVDQLPAAQERLRMWLFVTARNVLANHHRSQVRTSDLAAALRSELVEQHRALPPSSPSTAAADVRVEQALAGLPAPQRELVHLVHWEGFTIAEAAQMCDVTPSTARSRYAAARAALAARLRVGGPQGAGGEPASDCLPRGGRPSAAPSTVPSTVSRTVPSTDPLTVPMAAVPVRVRTR